MEVKQKAPLSPPSYFAMFARLLVSAAEAKRHPVVIYGSPDPIPLPLLEAAGNGPPTKIPTVSSPGGH